MLLLRLVDYIPFTDFGAVVLERTAHRPRPFFLKPLIEWFVVRGGLCQSPIAESIANVPVGFDI